MDIRFFYTSQGLFQAFGKELAVEVRKIAGRPFYLALSGGETARQLFHFWVEEFSDKIDWNAIRFFWVDERCVAPDDKESNFGEAERLFFRPLSIPDEHVFRIKGEANPMREAVRYANVVKEVLPFCSGVPRFDCIVLGAGTDGHTASIFPCAMHLLTDKRLYVPSINPVNRQRRITMTGSLMLASASVALLAVGESKREVVRRLVADENAAAFPVAFILKWASHATVFTDCKL